jgi:hypothetical protein
MSRDPVASKNSKADGRRLGRPEERSGGAACSSGAAGTLTCVCVDRDGGCWSKGLWWCASCRGWCSLSPQSAGCRKSRWGGEERSAAGFDSFDSDRLAGCDPPPPPPPGPDEAEPNISHTTPTANSNDKTDESGHKIMIAWCRYELYAMCPGSIQNLDGFWLGKDG